MLCVCSGGSVEREGALEQICRDRCELQTKNDLGFFLFLNY